MAEDNFTLTTFYTFWKEYQDHIKGAIEPLITEKLEMRAETHLRSIGENVMHIVSCRAYWFAAFMSDVEGSEMKVYADWNEDALKLGAPIPTIAELVRGLDHTWQFMAECLARLACDGARLAPRWRALAHSRHERNPGCFPRLEPVKDSTKKTMLKCFAGSKNMVELVRSHQLHRCGH